MVLPTRAPVPASSSSGERRGADRTALPLAPAMERRRDPEDGGAYTRLGRGIGGKDAGRTLGREHPLAGG